MSDYDFNTVSDMLMILYDRKHTCYTALSKGQTLVFIESENRVALDFYDDMYFEPVASVYSGNVIPGI